MAEVLLTYAQLGEELGISPAGARMLVKRHRLPKITDNHGRAVVSIEAERLARLRDERTAEREARESGERAPANANEQFGTAVAALQAHIADLRALVEAHRAERESLRRLLAQCLEAREREIVSWEEERRQLADEARDARVEQQRATAEHETERARWQAERRALNLRLDHFEEELARTCGQGSGSDSPRRSWLVRMLRRG